MDEAISHFQECVRLQPEAQAAYHMLGRTLREKGRLDEAVGYYQQAVQLDPRSVMARNELYMCRYAAACAALRGSAGQSATKTPTGVRAHTDPRRQPIDWLRAGHSPQPKTWKVRADLLKDTNVLDLQALTGWSLSVWQTDPALASVRDLAALKKLPDAERGQWQRLWGDVAAQLTVDPVEQGLAHAARCEWDKAAGSYRLVVERGATDAGHFWFEYAAVLLLTGDREGYENACAHMVERFGKAPGLRAYHLARACTLAPDAVAVAALPGRLAEGRAEGRW